MNTYAIRFAWLFLFALCAAGLHAGGLAGYETAASGALLTRHFSAPPGIKAGIYVDSVELAVVGGNIVLDWNKALDGLDYTVYSSLTPEGPYSLDTGGSYGESDWTAPITSSRKFYYVATDYAFVEGGTFSNGVGNVTLSGFYIDRFEVTQRAYERVMGTNPAQNFGVGPSYPVYLLNWFNAIEFCNRYSLAEQHTPCYSFSAFGTDPDNWPAGWNTDPDNHLLIACDWNADGFRLPSEMEWMFAATGGNLSQEFYFSGANTPGPVAWYSANSGNSTHLVGGREPNELGTYDMSGNVKELVWDIWGSLGGGSQTDPHGPLSGTYRVVRNGAFNTPDTNCTVTYRSYLSANAGGAGIGFRLCRTAPKVPAPAFSPPAGSYGLPQTISLSCANPQATIRFTTDGSEPHAGSPLYAGPFTLSSAATLKARAFLPGINPSETQSGDYRFSAPVFVAGGTFNNGTSNVTVSSFYLWNFELTQSQYQAVIGTNPANGSTWGFGPDKPVFNVNWMEALSFCNRFSIQQGITPCYSYGAYGTNPDNWPNDIYSNPANHINFSCNWSANGYRLPTEAEWEFAARGGNLAQGYTYSGSNDIGMVAWYTANSWSTAQNIGLLQANELAASDMSGNVRELCWDIWADAYPSGDQTNPHGPAAGDWRVTRGGNHQSVASSCQVNSRAMTNPQTRTYGLGFRLCRRSLAP